MSRAASSSQRGPIGSAGSPGTRIARSTHSSKLLVSPSPISAAISAKIQAAPASSSTMSKVLISKRPSLDAVLRMRVTPAFKPHLPWRACMSDLPGIFLGSGTAKQTLCFKYANRHGLIAGATGTGKTVSLQVLAEGFSAASVSVFMADVKGDLSGISQSGGGVTRFEERAAAVGLQSYTHRGFPTVYWDLFGEQGHPIRVTISEMGPLLLSRLLELNDTQAGVLTAGFKLADNQGLLLLDLKDLRALLAFLAENAASLTGTYGNISKASVGAIQRQLLVLENQGAEKFFGEP